MQLLAFLSAKVEVPGKDISEELASPGVWEATEDIAYKDKFIIKC
jgi:predicted RNA-binding protein